MLLRSHTSSRLPEPSLESRSAREPKLTYKQGIDTEYEEMSSKTSVKEYPSWPSGILTWLRINSSSYGADRAASSAISTFFVGTFSNQGIPGIRVVAIFPDFANLRILIYGNVTFRFLYGKSCKGYEPNQGCK